jgi:transposase
MKTLTKDSLFIAPRQEIVNQILSLQEGIQKKSSRIEELEFQLDWFKRQVFGTKSEKFIPDDDLQTALELGIEKITPSETEYEDVNYKRNKSNKSSKKKGHGRGSMPTHLPIIVKRIEPDEDTSGLVCLGEEISWYYDMEPASLHVIKTIRPKYVLPEGKGILIAKLPSLPIDKGNAGPGFMSNVVIDKYVYHIPLDRQRKKFKNEYSVNYSVSWLSDLVKNTGFWIKPLYDEYIKTLLKTNYICADETPIQVLTKDKKGKTHRGYFWVYHDPISKITIFDYRKSRSNDGPTEFLSSFNGVLQVDGYTGYNNIISKNDMDRAACMDHVRRKFEPALSEDYVRAKYALDKMRLWYKVESDAKENKLSVEERFVHRVKETVPSMRLFKSWLIEQVVDVLPKSGIGMAISYVLNQWPFFEPFMTNPKVELSNIATENKIRPVAIGRKNYMFMGSHKFAEIAAMIYSMVSIAKSHNVDPFVYMKDILTKFPQINSNEIKNFMFPQWKPADSDVD